MDNTEYREGDGPQGARDYSRSQATQDRCWPRGVASRLIPPGSVGKSPRRLHRSLPSRGDLGVERTLCSAGWPGWSERLPRRPGNSTRSGDVVVLHHRSRKS